jgi:hypothetical protein
MARLRKLTLEEIEKFASRPKVNKIAVDVNAMMNILRETIKEHIRDENGLVTNPEKLIQRFGKKLETAKKIIELKEVV